MDLANAFAIFFVVALLLMTLFCLLLKYYAHRRGKNLVKASEQFEMAEQIHKCSGEVMDGAYEEFCQRRQQSRSDKPLVKLIKEEDMLIEIPEIKKMLNVGNSIYGMSQLRKRLNSDSLSLTNPTNRSRTSLKQFHLERLNTTESCKMTHKFYDYIKKLVRYSYKGITIIEINAESLNKMDEEIFLKQKVEEAEVSTEDRNFEDLLDYHGFQWKNYGHYKYTCSLDISKLKINDTCSLKGLNSIENKEEITQDEYLKWYEHYRRYK